MYLSDNVATNNGCGLSDCEIVTNNANNGQNADNVATILALQAI